MENQNFTSKKQSLLDESSRFDNLSLSTQIIQKNSEIPEFPLSTAVQVGQREYRAVWVGTYGNVDWPSRQDLTTKEQQEELNTLVRVCKETNINTIIFQARSRADTLYSSEIEPWSHNLTSFQGRAPDPFWDPLEFLISEAHKNGIQVHAWLVAYRNGRVAEREEYCDSHFSKTNPDAVKEYGPYLWMDPGNPKSIKHIQKVIADVVKRYDVDGVFFDDFFYPYPIIKNNVGEGFVDLFHADDPAEFKKPAKLLDFPDDDTWRQYQLAGGKLSRPDWRRENINQLIKATQATIKELKPWVQFGISPYAIYKPGMPEGIDGMSQYDMIYCDPLSWIKNSWIDYISPQLCWLDSSSTKSFSKLLNWWSDQVEKYAQENKKVQLYPMIYLSRIEANISDWDIPEINKQIRTIRKGKVSFGHSLCHITSLIYNTKGICNNLRGKIYKGPALVPIPSGTKPLGLSNPVLLVSHISNNKIYITWGIEDKIKSKVRSYALYTLENELPKLYQVVGTSYKSLEVPIDDIEDNMIGIAAIDLAGHSSEIVWINWRQTPLPGLPLDNLADEAA